MNPAFPLVAVGQVDEKPSRKGKKLRMRCGASLGDAERRMPPRVTTTWKRKKRVERSGQEVKSGERERNRNGSHSNANAMGGNIESRERSICCSVD